MNERAAAVLAVRNRRCQQPTDLVQLRDRDYLISG